ncbi:SUKH-4 family immunity protein [Streptomyces sp. NBC_01619]|uniref:SUKH-4 family immunity protein n=1 Tax=Streptomyces sp. NBC_01619 TaxID=2975901 RepID=UPI00224CDA5B|nr:SUKH-4 family immunity protein [Streptomyces sp. NBC_01619]MCX4515683.1 SUKH-4 family immunity protein [Streptomyces sp. NBC_01619]
MSATSIVVPPHALHPSITHEATRRRLTERGLPAEHGLIRFAPLAESRVVPVPDLLAEGANPGKLDPFIADLLLIGNVRCEESDAQEVVLDGATGRVFSMYLFEDSPGLIDVLPLAPSVDALARFLAHVDDFQLMRGRFAPLAGQTGTDVAAEASALLTWAFTDEDWGDGGWGRAGAPSAWKHPLPALWRIAAAIRPLALIAGPGEGLRLDLPEGLLDEEFGPEEMVRVDPSALPAALIHEPTRAFLTEVGLPKVELMFGLWRDESLLRTLAEYQSPTDHDSCRMPADADNLVGLGSLIHDLEVVIDGRTGLLSYHPYGEDTTTPVNTDISTLAFTLWMYSREQRLDEEHDFTQDFYHQLADAMTEVLASVDPIACLPSTGEDDFRYWPEVFHDEAGGVL